MGVDLMLVFDNRTAEMPAPGKPIYTFLSGLEGFCTGLLEHEDDNYHWYAELNDKASSPLCEVCKPFLEAQFAYEYWDMKIFRYSEHQYEAFNREVPDSGLTEDMFSGILYVKVRFDGARSRTVSKPSNFCCHYSGNTTRQSWKVISALRTPFRGMKNYSNYWKQQESRILK